jgi:hypothetical protein
MMGGIAGAVAAAVAYWLAMLALTVVAVNACLLLPAESGLRSLGGVICLAWIGVPYALFAGARLGARLARKWVGPEDGR